MYPKAIFLILFPLFAFSQSPQKINFQSILRNNNGEVVANKNVKLKISIQSGSMMDSIVYSETHLKTTDASGLMSLKIGTGTIVMGRFDSIKWGKAPHFIKLEADFNGGNNFVLLGTQELMSVPYAFHSNTADSLVGGVNLKDIKDELTNLKLSISSLNENINSLRSGLLFSQNYLNQLENQTPVVDIDGNTYQKVVIGSQIWMKENLKVSRYRNGEIIPIINDLIATGARTWYDNDSTTYENPYGNLYNWYAASDSRGICPEGWHLPSDEEWTTLTTYLGGESFAGGKLKSTGNTYWNGGWFTNNNGINIGATNMSGFSAFPAGDRSTIPAGQISNGFSRIGYSTAFWSANESLEYGNAHSWMLFYSSINVNKQYGFLKAHFISVRCLKD